jgi:uncharacterized protein (TIGR02145 family)
MLKKKIKSFSVSNKKWMSENLSLQTFRNGDLIPLVTTNRSWKKAGLEGLPACCYYKNDSTKFGTNGILYNVHAINDQRGISPEGWHIPNEIEFNELISIYGGTNSAGKFLRNQKGWYDGPFMYRSDFKGLPNGIRHPWGEFDGEGHYGQWIVRTEKEGFSTMILRGNDIDALIFPISDFGMGFSVRCVKDYNVIKKHLSKP